MENEEFKKINFDEEFNINILSDNERHLYKIICLKNTERINAENKVKFASEILYYFNDYYENENPIEKMIFLIDCLSEYLISVETKNILLERIKILSLENEKLKN